MKKLLLSLILVLLVNIAIKAQKYQFGIKAGMGFSSASSSDAGIEIQNSRAGLIGFWGKYNINKFSIQPEFYFLRSSVIFNESQYSASNIVSFNSYNIPVVATYNFNIKPFTAHVITGPSISFITKHDRSLYFNPGTHVYYYIPNLNFGYMAYYWQAGAGIDYKRLSFDIRYSAGLNNVNTASYNQKLNNVVASLGFRLWGK